jgi:hypothetical protein
MTLIVLYVQSSWLECKMDLGGTNGVGDIDFLDRDRVRMESKDQALTVHRSSYLCVDVALLLRFCD